MWVPRLAAKFMGSVHQGLPPFPKVPRSLGVNLADSNSTPAQTLSWPSVLPPHGATDGRRAEGPRGLLTPASSLGLRAGSSLQLQLLPSPHVPEPSSHQRSAMGSTEPEQKGTHLVSLLLTELPFPL